jgi:hypothetical protein
MERKAMKSLKTRLLQLRDDLGPMGLASLALLAITAMFLSLVLEPLQKKNLALESSLARNAGRTEAGLPAAGGKLERFYERLGTDQAPTDWLAKLYGIGKATGVELQSGSYRSVSASASANGATAGSGVTAGNGATAAGPERAGAGGGGRIERYEIVLPVAGSYPQLREFLKRALVEIPVLSLDQLTLKRESRDDGAVHAELKMTLHLVKP